MCVGGVWLTVFERIVQVGNLEKSFFFIFLFALFSGDTL